MKAAAILLFCALPGLLAAQAWDSAYRKGLEYAASGQWAAARGAFQAAASERREDVESPISLPGPISEPRRWRDGAPYSPNFAAAYAGLKQALALPSSEARTALLSAVAGEFEEQLAKGRKSAATAFFLASTYRSLGRAEDLSALQPQMDPAQLKFRVDLAPVDAADRAALEGSGLLGREPGGSTPVEPPQPTNVIGGVTNPPVTNPPVTNPPVTNPPVTNPPVTTPPGGTGEVEVVPPAVVPPPATTTPPGQSRLIKAEDLTRPAATPVGIVQALPDKFALLIGNSESRLLGEGVASSASDVMRLRDTLVNACGYLPENVDVITEATAEQMRRATSALAERLPPGATVFVFYSGPGLDIEGKDYLAGIDADLPSDSSLMFAKSELYRTLLERGAIVFAFFQVSRRIDTGRYFGMEIPEVGPVSQHHGTQMGDDARTLLREGAPVGIYADAMVRVLEKLRSNRVPIREFAWQVFDMMRGGGSRGSEGSGSSQVATLPVLRNMPQDPRF